MNNSCISVSLNIYLFWQISALLKKYEEIKNFTLVWFKIWMNSDSRCIFPNRPQLYINFWCKLIAIGGSYFAWSSLVAVSDHELDASVRKWNSWSAWNILIREPLQCYNLSATEKLNLMFGNEHISVHDIVSHYRTKWSQDEYTRGSYSYHRVGKIVIICAFSILSIRFWVKVCSSLIEFWIFFAFAYSFVICSSQQTSTHWERPKIYDRKLQF